MIVKLWNQLEISIQMAENSDRFSSYCKKKVNCLNIHVESILCLNNIRAPIVLEFDHLISSHYMFCNSIYLIHFLYTFRRTLHVKRTFGQIQI